MTSLSTTPLEPAITPLRRSRGAWALALAGMILGALVVALMPRISWPVYGWVLYGIGALIALRLAVVDERTYALPNRLTALLAAFGAIQAIGVSIWQGSPSLALSAAAIAGIVGAVYLVLALTGSCGFGDMKFAVALVLTIAPIAGIFTIYLLPLAFAISALRVIGRIVRHQPRKHPHGTSLAIAGSVLMVSMLQIDPAFMPV
ncbi:MAG TPA: hypothetical protein DIW46_01920 [Microbacterium sp.]|nr:hypothetical protein [Microbacterium sp.]